MLKLFEMSLSHSICTFQIMENAEINNVIKILGLQYKHKYDTPESMKSLRYGKLMIMTDQDQDGSHIKGLLINFVHHNWPGLLRQKFVEEFITPIVKVSELHNIQFFVKQSLKMKNVLEKLWNLKKILGCQKQLCILVPNIQMLVIPAHRSSGFLKLMALNHFYWPFFFGSLI